MKNASITKGSYYLNIYYKNNAGWFFLNVLDIDQNKNIPAIPTLSNDYDEISNKLTIPLLLPDQEINEITPSFSMYRERNGTASRGAWSIKFDITCIGADLSERPVTGLYNITAKNSYDELKTDARGNHGFKIILLNDFNADDCETMLYNNSITYKKFQAITERSRSLAY